MLEHVGRHVITIPGPVRGREVNPAGGPANQDKDSLEAHTAAKEEAAAGLAFAILTKSKSEIKESETRGLDSSSVKCVLAFSVQVTMINLLAHSLIFFLLSSFLNPGSSLSRSD